jgi:hypothetical protein
LTKGAPKTLSQPSGVALRHFSRNNATKPTQILAMDSMDARSAVAAVKVRKNTEAVKVAYIQVHRSHFRPHISLKTRAFGMARPNNTIIRAPGWSGRATKKIQWCSVIRSDCLHVTLWINAFT